MNGRQALDNPDQAVALRWGDWHSCPHCDEISALASRWASLKPLLKEAQAAKGACSRRIGEARRNGLDITPLLAEMAAATAQLSALEAEGKTLEARVSELLLPDAAPEPELPARFTAESHTRIVDAALPLKVVAATDDDAETWDAFVASHPAASPYHRYGWRSVIKKSFDHETQYWRAIDASGRTVGVLPLVRLTSKLFGDFGVSMPYFNYGGILASLPEARAALAARAAGYAQSEGLRHLEFRELVPAPRQPARTDKVSMIRPLPAEVSQLQAEIGAKVRAQIKQAQRHHHRVETGHAELLDDFYTVFAQNMRDLGTPVYSKHFFRTILSTWPAQTRIVVIYCPRPVAAAFLLGDEETMEIPWASTLRSANAMNMNMLLYWEVLSFSIRERYRFFDFGRSSTDSGTYQFKKQWGATPIQHFWNYWLPANTELPQLNPDNPKFKLAIALWRRLPIAVTKVLGPPIVKYLP